MAYGTSNYSGTTILDETAQAGDMRFTVYGEVGYYGSVKFTGAGDMSAAGIVVIDGGVQFTGTGVMSASGMAFYALKFLTEPQVVVRSPVATHVIVLSPTASGAAHIEPEPPAATKVERLVKIDVGDAGECKVIADELIARWGREQVSISGDISLNVRLKFKEKILVVVARAGIGDLFILQRKEHKILRMTTSVVCGDIILDDSELLARIIEALNKGVI